MQILRILKYYLGRVHYAKIIKKYDINAELNKTVNKNFLNKNGYKKYASISKRDIIILKENFLNTKNN